jgi:hypothetical protein
MSENFSKNVDPKKFLGTTVGSMQVPILSTSHSGFHQKNAFANLKL